jgi:SAM-dependent methyltransferase
MPKIAESRFWRPLLERYYRSPSIAMCRVPEVELFSRISLEFPVLDHCGGDGYVSSLAFDGRKLDACVDIDEARLEAARSSGRYQSVKWGDVGKSLPFADGEFATVINNSGIEHVPDLRTALGEIHRVLRVGGRVHLNVLNNRFFDNWPAGPESIAAYRDWQPFYHALDESGWSSCLEDVGFWRVSFVDYFPPDAGRILADLDFRYSRMFLKRRFTLKTLLESLGTRRQLAQRWSHRLGPLRWDADRGMGVGFAITAERKA